MAAAGLAGGVSPAGVVLAGVVAAAAVLAGLMVVIAGTRDVSILGGSVGRRVFWALLVMGGGTVGWALGSLVDAAEPWLTNDPLVTSLLGGVPFALAAALFVRGWWVSVTAVGLIVAMLVATVVVLRREPPDDLEARLAANNVQRETSYAVAVPGYQPNAGRDYGNGLGGASFFPMHPDPEPPARYVTITVSDRLAPGEQLCGQPTAQDSQLASGDCTIEPNGLVYRHNPPLHGYQVPFARFFVTVAGTPTVGQDLLRAAALSLRPASADEMGGDREDAGLFVAATIPGYTGRMTEAPPGMRYDPVDRTDSGGDTGFTMEVTYADGNDICLAATECKPEGADLTYVRLRMLGPSNPETHGYVVRRGRVNVSVTGALRVDRTLLRQAALDARPATDDELRRALPPPRRQYSRIDRLRERLRERLRSF
ncbi:hypothetical protein ABT297_30215 [Dactylosporangium sp. NPDC000555]|uniref:hypothetical protein n=1 Tax=Dactylosporangium sp. NPDC000555 TaxID=3154260 RepID=UPI003320EC27